MKRLWYSASFNSGEKIREHYIEYHKTDKDNKLFQKLFQPGKKGFIFWMFQIWWLTINRTFKIKHEFLKHYDDNIPFEDKPVEIEKTSAITGYEKFFCICYIIRIEVLRF